MNEQLEKVRCSLESLRSEPLDDGICENMEKVLYKLLEYEDNAIMDGYIGVRDVECASIEWPSRGIFCCVYSDFIEIDKCRQLCGDTTIYHTIIEISPIDIHTEFMTHFDKLWTLMDY